MMLMGVHASKEFELHPMDIKYKEMDIYIKKTKYFKENIFTN
jgi:hypothetical protein